VSDILGNCERQVFYDGTSLEAAEKIAREGFKVWFHLADDEPGRRCYSGGTLGKPRSEWPALFKFFRLYK